MSLPTSNAHVELTWETPRAPGAVAIARLWSRDGALLDRVLQRLTGTRAAKPGACSHRSLAAIDDGLVVRLSSELALIMPHGGPRIVAQLDEWLRAHAGCATSAHERPSMRDATHALRTYPEAQCFREALALAAASTAASARAIPLLLAQPARISAAFASGWVASGAANTAATARAQRLARLLDAPRIVAIGAANVGKSSLLNAVAGRTVAIAMDFAGTTRDAVAARVELDGLVVDWFDTPGIRASDDEVERAAQSLAATMRDSADLLLEISAPGHPCPHVASDVMRLRVCTRIDLDYDHSSIEAREADVHVSAIDRTRLPQLARAIRSRLVHDEDLASTDPWIFHEALLTAP